jgi:hypothetical protein
MGNLRKKNQTEILEIKSPFSQTNKQQQQQQKNTEEGYCSRLEQPEDRISELKDKMIKWKLKEKVKSYQSNNSSPAKGKCKNSPTPSQDQM